MVVNLICIAVICVIVTDILKFWDSLERPLSVIFDTKVKFGKPINCSTCQTFWLGLIYLLVWHCFTLPNLTLVLLIAVCTGVIGSLIWNILDLLGSFVNLLQKLKF